MSLDEREGGIRALLNLGHTFGHVIRAFDFQQSYTHGGKWESESWLFIILKYRQLRQVLAMESGYMEKL